MRISLSTSLIALTACLPAIASASGTLAGWGQFEPLAYPPALTDVVDVSAGAYGGAGVRANGTVFQWGNPAAEQPPAGLKGVASISVSSGWFGVVAVKKNGTVVSWGDPDLTPPANTHNIAKAVAGKGYVIALKADGTVVGWGNAGPATIPAGLVAKDIFVNRGLSNGDRFAMAIKLNGDLVWWGEPQSHPTPPAGLTHVVSVGTTSVGGYALLEDGTVQAWGSHPAIPSTFHDIRLLAVGSDQVWGQHTDGTVETFGGYLPHSPPAGTNVGFEKLVGWGNVVIGLRDDAPFVLSLDSPYVVGGTDQTMTGTVKLKKTRGVNTVVHLSTDLSETYTLPPTVTIPAGNLSVSFDVLNQRVRDNGGQYPWITASNADYGQSIWTRLDPIQFTLDNTLPNQMYSIQTSNLNGHLNGIPRDPIKFKFACQNGVLKDLTTVFTSTTSTAFSFPVTTGFVSKKTLTQATLGLEGNQYANGYEYTAVFALPKANTIFVPKTLYGNQEVTGTMTLDSPAPVGGVDATLSSDNDDVSIPTNPIHFNEGELTHDFTVTTKDVNVTSAALLAVRIGATAISTSVTLKPMVVKTLQLLHAEVTGGTAVNATVKLVGIVSVDMPVEVILSDPNLASAPATVTVLAGSDKATFKVVTNATLSAKTLIVKVKLHGQVQSVTLTINP